MTDKRRISLSLKPESVDILKEYAQEDNVSLSAAIDTALTWYIRHRSVKEIMADDPPTEAELAAADRKLRELGLIT